MGKVIELTDGKHGTKETLEAINGTVDFVNKLDEALKDGKFDLVEDMLKLAPTIPGLMQGIANGDEIPHEIGELSDEERQGIYDAVRKFEFNDKHVEAIAEKALMMLSAMGELFMEIKSAKQE